MNSQETAHTSPYEQTMGHEKIYRNIGGTLYFHLWSLSKLDKLITCMQVCPSLV